MDIGSILLALALLILVAAFVARPLLERAASDSEAGGPADALLTERENVLAALRDLDFDHTTGKTATEDYEAQRAVLVQQGVEVLRQLDQLGIDGQPGESLETQIEAAIAARRQAKAPAPPAQPALGAARFCPNCGTPAQPGDKFCSRCGTRLSVVAEVS